MTFKDLRRKLLADVECDLCPPSVAEESRAALDMELWMRANYRPELSQVLKRP